MAFLTPIGGAASPGGLMWFPVVGGLIGAGVGGVWWLAWRAFPTDVAAGLAVATDLALTGMLHLDGLCDAADGLLPPLERSRRLAVMAAPDVGAFGIGACIVVVVLRVLAMAALHPSVMLVAALWAASRSQMVLVVIMVPYARAKGLASAFVEEAHPSVGLAAVTGMAGALVLAALWRPVAGLAAVGAAGLAAASVVALARRRLGGFTGDVLGAAGIVGETVGLVVAC
ncbi:MAG: adenosylcobinamide-GDP ribazoletransferase, partial [Acidimicrobiales bacterium]